jgi:ubiquinone/menaquinone biosynthesis C-methylase UbiE
LGSNLRSESSVLRLALYDVRRNESKEIPLRFIERNGLPHILYSTNPPPEWVAQVSESALVRWSVGDQTFIGTASQVRDPAVLQAEVLPTFEATYGKERLSRWFGSGIGCVSLLESNDGVSYYRAVEDLFDQSAPVYDRVVQGNRFDLHLRTVALETLRTEFRPGDRVLELGCGTGLETIPLAEAGLEIVALDISGGMLRELNRKARVASVHGRIETRQVPIKDLHKIVSDLGPGSFDGAFSHFGALNCEPRLDALPETLHRLIKPKGRISLGVWNRTCLAEMLLFGIAFRPRRSLARLQSSVPVGKSRFGVPVFPYSPGEVKRLFSPFFSLTHAVGASVLVPPYNLGRRLVPHPKVIKLLEAGDRLVRDRPFLRYLGDHFLLELSRR